MTYQDFAAKATPGFPFLEHQVPIITYFLLEATTLKEARNKWHPALKLGRNVVCAWPDALPRVEALAKAITLLAGIQDAAIEAVKQDLAAQEQAAKVKA